MLLCRILAVVENDAWEKGLREGWKIDLEDEEQEEERIAAAAAAAGREERVVYEAR